MADAALEVRSPLEGLVFPAGPRFTLSEAPPAARFILRGAEAGARRLRHGVRRRVAFATWLSRRERRARGFVARA